MVAHLFSALRAFGCVGEKIVHFQMEEIRLLVHYQTFSAYKDFSAPRSLGGDAEKIGDNQSAKRILRWTKCIPGGKYTESGKI